MAEFFDRKDDYGYVCWAREIKKRDHYSCAICGRKGVALNSHHLNSWANYPDQRYLISNGVTLCKFHHDDFHEKYSKGNNTEDQFKEYQKIAQTIISFANKESLIQITSKKILQTAERDEIVESILNDLIEKKGLLEDGYQDKSIDEPI